jgi:hypothetical protein
VHRTRNRLGDRFVEQRTKGISMPGKRVQFDDETWAALDLLAKDRMMDFQELADEAFRDLLRKHGRPTTLKEALRKSAGASAEVVHLKRAKMTKKVAKKPPARRKRRR